jgi:hypothetical protein
VEASDEDREDWSRADDHAASIGVTRRRGRRAARRAAARWAVASRAAACGERVAAARRGRCRRGGAALVAGGDRKRRLAPRIAALRGWTVGSVSTWLLVADSKTNRRRVAEHRTLLTSGLPLDGRSLESLFACPERGAQSGIAFWSNVNVGKVSHPTVATERIAATRRVARLPKSRSEWGRVGRQSPLRGSIVADSPAAGSPICSNSPGRKV